MPHLRRLAILITLFLASGAALDASRANAGLGDWDTGIDGDLQALGGKTRAIQDSRGRFTVFETTVPSRTVRQYEAPDGRIFAVTWRGINGPEFPRLMGKYYGEYKSALEKLGDVAGRQKGRKELRQSRNQIRAGRAIVVRVGHMRDMRGKMYDESLFPQGVRPDELR